MFVGTFICGSEARNFKKSPKVVLGFFFFQSSLKAVDDEASCSKPTLSAINCSVLLVDLG